jgi:outer membrane protein assembly factor BamE
MSKSLLRSICSSLTGVLLVGLTACGSLDQASNRALSVVTPYKIDIVQGNFVSREQAAALKEGMSRLQVREILGTPLLVSVFHANRWDYVFTFQRQGVEPQSRRVTVFFEGDRMTKLEADALPSEAEFVASLDSGRKSGTVPVLEMSEERLKATAVAAPPAAKPLPPLPASYPPLESSN